MANRHRDAKEAKKAKPKRPNVFLWNGVLENQHRTVRILTIIVLVTACVTFSFTQLGFAGIGVPGDFEGYALVLLLPVSLASLLLGTRWGTVIGLLAGCAMYGHAIVMPLDYYELVFVTVTSSVVLLAVAGFLLGFLFALALRSNTSRAKRAVLIVVVCLFVSGIVSIIFLSNAFLQLLVDIARRGVEDLGDSEQRDAVINEAKIFSGRLGNVGLQWLVDALLMAFPCIIADAVAKRAERLSDTVNLHVLFGLWLFVVVLIAFMLTAVLSFISITAEERNSAADVMGDYIGYFCSQLEHSDSQANALTGLLDSFNVDYAKLSNQDLQNMADTVSIEGLLTGLDKNQFGTVVISMHDKWAFSDNAVLVSNDERISKSATLGGIFQDDAIAAIQKSLESGEMERFVYDEANLSSADARPVSDHLIQTKIAYVLSKNTEYYNVAIIMPTDLVFANRGVVMAWSAFSLFVMLLAVFVLTQLLISRVISRRIRETNGVLARVTEGDLNARVEIKSPREFELLSNGINSTVVTLKGWIAEAEERIDAELATAKAIQESALPRTFPPYPDIQSFDIYASMNAARQVGGDFYDFFLIGDDVDSRSGKLGFVIADVSGKGVPAALFMMTAKAQIRDYMQAGLEIGEAVENANRQLCDGNDKGMFVTVWAGVLDYATGHVEYVNAGHNPPLLWQKGSWRWLNDRSGLPLGLFDGLPYDTYSVECDIGDQFLLYTDGVTEAMNIEGELYGEGRLEELLAENYMLHPRRLVEATRRSVAEHASGAEQSDDITILALEVGVPPEVTATLVVPANTDELPRVNDFIHTELDRRLCPARTQSQLDIAVEELFVNVCHYAYADAPAEQARSVRVSYTYSAEPPSIIVDISDDGMPYNPLAKPDAVTPDDIMEVPIGGLGILMAKRSVDDMSYKRIDGANVVTIMKKW